ncbi:MAG: type I restriction endonuclease subunit R [Candidatus Aminicenantes bacterium]|nr:type I restriction endonuclease subunit R [Candidatus Aminicenantes bacterium]
MTQFVESEVEQVALGWLESLGWNIKYGPDMIPGELFSERDGYGDVFIRQRLQDSLRRLNPNLSEEAIQDALKRITHPEGATLEARNRAFHRMLIDGVTVEYRKNDKIAGAQAKLLDFDDLDNNDWLAVNQFTVVENKHTRRPDIVIFVNGLPLAVIELKNPADPKATIINAFNQLQTYKTEIPSLFVPNELLVISDGLEARVGTLTSGREWFKAWRTISGKEIEDFGRPELEILIKGIFNKKFFLEIIRDFIVFEDNGGGFLSKKMAGYHQFHAVRVAVLETLRAALPEKWKQQAEIGEYMSGRQPGGKPGDRRIGVVWHTQGSGKSLTMAFYSGRIIREPAMQNPTIVVITDRNDLDDQLFGTFCRSKELLRQPPVQAKNREDLRDKLRVKSGGIIFTTIQKFLPEAKADSNLVLSERENIVVIADEAHRSQYDFIDGFARHMRDTLPRASFIAFTGTPLERADKNTRTVFGDYISIYDIQRAVLDRATVPIYYESRLAKLELDEKEKPRIDPDFEEVTEGEELERKEKLKTKWAQLEAIVGTEKRIRLVAKDIVEHFERRLEALEGKAMIVCMSRRICVEIYNEIVRLRPQWHDEDDNKGVIKVVMTGAASDPAAWQQHIRDKKRREHLANRFRDASDPFKIVIVRDMWLTGFDCPSLHTMYLDKPMKAHGLMQAIARVNRVFKDKPGGLVVDYLGLAYELKEAMAQYTESGGKGDTIIDQDVVVAIMKEKYEICLGLFYGFDWTVWKTGTPTDRLSLLPAAQEHIVAQEDGKERLIKAVGELSRAFALAVPHEEALKIRDDVSFFQAVRNSLAKKAPSQVRPEDELDYAIKQIVSRAIAPEGVIDLFAAAGLKKPDISIFSEEFLAEIKSMPYKNLAVEVLYKLLNAEVQMRKSKNLVQSKSFAEMLQEAINRYQNRSIEALQVIEELIEIAREIRKSDNRGEILGLSEEELAFYDALETNDSAVKLLGDEVLRKIAQNLVKTVRENVTVDWTIREDRRAYLRTLVKRVLRKYNYPPDKQEKATHTVLEQAELLSELWAAA